MARNVPITVAHGDGIGPEIMDAALHIIKEAGARIDIETIEIGEKVYLSGNAAGVVGFSAAHESLFKSPDYQHRKGGGYSSLNVAVRKILSRASAVILSKR